MSLTYSLIGFRHQPLTRRAFECLRRRASHLVAPTIVSQYRDQCHDWHLELTIEVIDTTYCRTTCDKYICSNVRDHFSAKCKGTSVWDVRIAPKTHKNKSKTAASARFYSAARVLTNYGRVARCGNQATNYVCWDVTEGQFLAARPSEACFVDPTGACELYYDGEKGNQPRSSC